MVLRGRFLQSVRYGPPGELAVYQTIRVPTRPDPTWRPHVPVRKSVLALTTTCVAAALAATVAAPSPAGAEGAGVGTARVSSTLLDLKVGNLLGIKLFDGGSQSTSDARTSAPNAFAGLTQLRVTSGVVPALNISTPPLMATTQAGGTRSITSSVLDLGTVVPPAVASGTLQPVTLSALLEPATASSMTTRLANLGLGTALAKVGVIQEVERTGSGASAAEGTRQVDIDALAVLDLGSLLAGLGINILDLPFSVISGLITTLGLGAIVPSGTTLAGEVAALKSTIAQLSNTAETTVTTPLATQLGTLLPGPLAPLAPTVGTTVSTALATLQSTLSTLLNTAVDALSKAVLVQVNALQLGTVARAVDTVAASKATTTGKVGSIKVASLTLPGLDIAATAAQINALTAQVNAALGGALAPLGLGNLLSVKLFDAATSVTDAGGVINASSAITALSVKVTPPPLLASLVSTLVASGAPLSSVLPAAAASSAGGAAPVRAAAATDPIANLQALLGANGVLAQGLSLDVARITSSAQHLVPVAVTGTTPSSPTPKQLPHTGGNDVLLGGLGALGLAGVLGGRRLRRAAKARS